MSIAKCPHCGSDAELREKFQGYCFDCWNHDVPDFKARITELESALANSIPRDSLPELPEGWVPPFRWGSSGMTSHLVDSSTPPVWRCDDTKVDCEFLAALLNACYGKDGV